MLKRMGVWVLSGVACCGVAVADVTLKTDQDKLSYAMGVMTGKAFRAHLVTISPDMFNAGLQDGYAGKKLLLSETDIQKILANFQQQAMKKMQANAQKVAVTNKKAGDDFLAQNKNKPGVETLPSGLQYKITQPGSGDSPVITDSVTVNYEGRLLNGQVFDSSYQRGKPATFPVNAVIKGWQEALVRMKPGATWELYVPSDLAYGAQGAPGVIGPNELLIFKVDLISVQKKK